MLRRAAMATCCAALCCAGHVEGNVLQLPSTQPHPSFNPFTGRDKVEMLLAMGASRMEASREVVQRAARMALTPLLNTMNVVVRLAQPVFVVAGWWCSRQLAWPSRIGVCFVVRWFACTIDHGCGALLEARLQHRVLLTGPSTLHAVCAALCPFGA